MLIWKNFQIFLNFKRLEARSLIREFVKHVRNANSTAVLSIQFSDARDSRCKEISRNEVCMGVSLSISRAERERRAPFANALRVAPGMS